MKMLAVRNLRLCTKDCLCLYVCPVGATDTEDSIIDPKKCTGCGVCAGACPSGAISMVPLEYPPQQEKTDAVRSALLAMADRRGIEEKAALQAAGAAEDDGTRRLMKAVAKSLRLVNEDTVREAGYMLPQSREAAELLGDIAAGSGTAAETAGKVLRSLKGDTGPEEGKALYRCKVCGYEFEAPEGVDPICPACMADGDDIERIG